MGVGSRITGVYSVYLKMTGEIISLSGRLGNSLSMYWAIQRRYRSRGDFMPTHPVKLFRTDPSPLLVMKDVVIRRFLIAVVDGLTPVVPQPLARVTLRWSRESVVSMAYAATKARTCVSDVRGLLFAVLGVVRTMQESPQGEA